MRRSLFHLLSSAVLALALAACAGTPTPAPTEPPAPTAAVVASETPAAVTTDITLTDSLGREVHLDALPERIVSLAPSNTETVFALGAGDLLVGRDEFSDYPPEAAAVESIGSLYPQVNTEAVVALEPDLVLAAGVTNPDNVNALAELGLTVFTTRTAVTTDDIYQDILDVGLLTGHRAEAEALTADMQAREREITDIMANVETRPRVFYEIDASDPGSPWTAGEGSFIDQLLTLAGGDNVGRAGSKAYFQMSLEELVAQDPEVIVLGSANYGDQTPELVAERVGWENISAVANDRVHAFNDNLISRPGPRVIDGLEQLARLFHPDLFQ